MLEYYNTLQESVKKHIIDNYGIYISNNQKELLNKKNYLDEHASDMANINELFNYLVYKMLYDLLNHSSYIKFEVNEWDIVSIPVNDRLTTVLVNYYIKDLSNIINFNPIIDKSLANQIDCIRQLNEMFDNVIDKNVFTKNASQLEKIDELSDFVYECIEYDLKKYFDENNTDPDNGWILQSFS